MMRIKTTEINPNIYFYTILKHSYHMTMSQYKSIKNPALFILCLLTVFAFQSCDEKHAAPKNTKTNIIILLADDMGYGDLQCYGNPTIRTPHIDSLAASGIPFTSF